MGYLAIMLISVIIEYLFGTVSVDDVIRITRESDYAFLLLAKLMDDSNEPKNTSDLAKATGISLPVASKVLKKLTKYNLLTSTRGALGGYLFAKEASEISALDVIQAIEGVPYVVDCVDAETACCLSGKCQSSPFWQQLNTQIMNFLSSHSLPEVKDYQGSNFNLVEKVK